MNRREMQHAVVDAYSRWADAHADRIETDPSTARPGRSDLPLHHASVCAPADQDDAYWAEIDGLLAARDQQETRGGRAAA